MALEHSDTSKDEEAQASPASSSPRAPAKPSGCWGKLVGAQQAWYAHAASAWSKISYGINFEWLSLGRWPSLALFTLSILALALTLGLTAKSVKDGVTLGVEFGGGYSVIYVCAQKDGGPPVTTVTMQKQASDVYQICASEGQPNAQVTVLLPDRLQVVIPGVSNKDQIGQILEQFDTLTLSMTVRSAISVTGSQGEDDLKKTVTAAGIALGIVWFGLVLRYRAAGLLGFFLSVVFLWLHLIFFNASSYALSDAAIVAVVLNIGLAADAHIIAFERVREDLHPLPRDAPRELGLSALNSALRIALITVLEANVTTLLAMVVLYGVGNGGTVEFAFTVIISVCASILVNVVLARALLRLAWNAQLATDGGFFGDKGPAYDEDRKAKYERINKWVLLPYWTPKRRVDFDFVRFRWIGVGGTLAAIIGGSILLGVDGLNWGVDYTAGTSVSMRIPPPYDYTCADVIQYAQYRINTTVSRCNADDVGHVDLKFKDAVDPYTVQLIIFRITNVLGGPIIYTEYTIDNELAKDQSKRAIKAMCISAAVTCAFLLLRFGPGWSLSGFVSMASTAIFTVCCFAMGGWEVNLPTVAALLTAFSYAINDCVVVFDRVRFEVAKERADGGDVHNAANLKLVVNRALSLVTIRSLLTLEAVMVCSLMLIIMGASTLHSFSLAVTFGLLNATYTTLLVCVPFWYLMRCLVIRWAAKRAAKQGGSNQLQAAHTEWESKTSFKTMSSGEAQPAPQE